MPTSSSWLKHCRACVKACSLIRSQTEQPLLNSQVSSTSTVGVEAYQNWGVNRLEGCPGNSLYPCANSRKVSHVYQYTRYFTTAVTVRWHFCCLTHVSDVYIVLVIRVFYRKKGETGGKTARKRPGDLLHSNNRTQRAFNACLFTNERAAPVVLVYRTER